MRIVTEEALAVTLGALPGTPRLVASGNAAAPWRLLSAADASLADYRLFMLNAPAGIPDREGVIHETPFVGAGMRGSPSLRYIPSRLSLVPKLFHTRRPPDVVLLHTSSPYNSTVSMGSEVNILPAAVEAVRARGGLVIAQMNAQMPYTFGDGVLAMNEIDIAIECDDPLPAHVGRPIDDTAREIGGRVGALIGDGATLQLGIGTIPDAVLHALSSHKYLRIWSEMFSDGVLELERTGRLDPEQPITASFCFGSSELFAWADRNPRIRMLRTEKTNDPGTIAKQPQVTSVNSALQVDLFAQANASRVNGHIYSGFGGQTDFIVGALHSAGGLAVIALPSWHPKADVSTIVPLLTSPVTSFQQTHIVSEQGVAELWGRGQSGQARALIDEVAHPDARDGLRQAAREFGLVH